MAKDFKGKRSGKEVAERTGWEPACKAHRKKGLGCAGWVTGATAVTYVGHPLQIVVKSTEKKCMLNLSVVAGLCKSWKPTTSPVSTGSRGLWCVPHEKHHCIPLSSGTSAFPICILI